jgi:lysophospholipase L1-like esterase
MGGGTAAGSAGASGQGATANGDLVAQGVRWVGRVSAQESTRFAWSGAGFVARFSGTGLSATLTNAEGYLFQTVVDGAAREAFLAKRGEAAYPLATGLTPGEHVVELYRQTEGRYGDSQLDKLEVVDGELLQPAPGPDAVLEVIGDSITCGYGNLGANASCSFSFATESHWDSYGAVAGRALGVDVHTVAISGHGLTRNNDGTTTDLLPDVYRRTLTRDPSLLFGYSVSPKVIVVNLGTNDFAKGNPGVNFEQQYLNFLTKLRELHPKAFLLATLGPMMTGANLNAARSYVQNAVSAFEAAGNVGKVGFLEYSGQVAGELGCNSHPNTSKHKQMADALVAKINELSLY